MMIQSAKEKDRNRLVQRLLIQVPVSLSATRHKTFVTTFQPVVPLMK